jgi:hypothetical protein
MPVAVSLDGKEPNLIVGQIEPVQDRWVMRREEDLAIWIGGSEPTG